MTIKVDYSRGLRTEGFMDNQEMLDAMRQLIREETVKIIREETTKIIDEKLEPIRDEISGIKVIIDTEIRRDINLLAEGQAAILARLPDPAEMEDVQERLSAGNYDALQNAAAIFQKFPK